MKLITRQEAVRHAEANARLAGAKLDEETVRALREYGTGRMSMDELEAWLRTQLALAVLDRVPDVEPEEWDKIP